MFLSQCTLTLFKYQIPLTCFSFLWVYLVLQYLLGPLFYSRPIRQLNLAQSSSAISVIEKKTQLCLECLAIDDKYNEYLDRILMFMYSNIFWAIIDLTTKPIKQNNWLSLVAFITNT